MMNQPTASFTIRLTTPEDIPQIALHRRLMFTDIGGFTSEGLAAMETDYPGWLGDRIERGEYRGWLVVNDNGGVVGGAGAWLLNWMPYPADLTCRRAHIIDVYIQPEYRRRGLARQLMEVLLHWCEEQHIVTVTLAASANGRHLYESLGFAATNIMIKQYAG